MMQEVLTQYNNFGDSIDFDIDQQYCSNPELSDNRKDIDTIKRKDSTHKSYGLSDNVESSDKYERDEKIYSTPRQNRKFDQKSETSNCNSIKTKVNTLRMTV